MVALALRPALFILSVACHIGTLNILFEPFASILIAEKVHLGQNGMAAVGAAPSGGLPLGEFRKDVPPGWAPGDPTYPLKLYMERLRMWYRTYDGMDETVGPLVAGRLQGRAQAIAHSLRLPNPHGRVDVGDAALVRLSVEEVRDPMNGQIIQHAIPSGVQALCNALKEAFGDAEQVQATRSLEIFFDMKRGRLSLQEFAVEWNLKLEDAITHAGLQIGNVAKTFLFFRASQLPQKHIDDILMQIHGDLNRFEDARNLAIRLAHRQHDHGQSFYDNSSSYPSTTEYYDIEEEYEQAWTGSDAYYSPEENDTYWQEASDTYEWWPDEFAYEDYMNEGPWQEDEWQESWTGDDHEYEQEAPQETTSNAAGVEDYYKGKGKGSFGIGCSICGSKWHMASSCPMNSKGNQRSGGWSYGKGKGKRKGKKGGFRSKGKGKFRSRGYPGRWGKGKGKSYMTQTPSTPVWSSHTTYGFTDSPDRRERQLHHARTGLDLSGPSVTLPPMNLRAKEEAKKSMHLDISREEDFLRRAQDREQEPAEQQTSNDGEKPEASSKTLLSFPVMIHHDTKDIDLTTFHTVAGEKRRGLLVDPGAAAGLIGSETLRDLMDHCLRPAGLDKHVVWKERTTSVTGISGKGDSTLAEITFQFQLDEKKRASFSADVLGGEGSLCPALIGNPSLRAMGAVMFTHFFDNNDGLLVCHSSSTPSTEKPTMIRLLLTDSGHFIIPMENMQPVSESAQKTAIHFVGQVHQHAKDRWNDCSNSLKYCFNTTVQTETPKGVEHDRSENKTSELHAQQPLKQEPQHCQDPYAPQPLIPDLLHSQNHDALQPLIPDPQQEDDDHAPSPKHMQRDHWQKNGDQWVRHHVRLRQALFNPQTGRFPDKLKNIQPSRKTILHYDDGTKQELHDEWIDEESAQKMMLHKWTGMTIFLMKDNVPDTNTVHQMKSLNETPQEVYIADNDDYIFMDEELQAYEDDHFPEHLTDAKKSYLRKFYRAVPEEFYTCIKKRPVTPSNCLEWLQHIKQHKKKKFHFWEICSGSARLSLLALLSGLTVCFPVDMRYGWDIGYAPHQALLQRVHDELQPECLLGAPNCRPWSVSASTRDPEDTAREREEEQPALEFMQKIFRKQHARQKMYLLEQPWSSALWNHLDLPGERQRTDQCQFGATNEEDAPILKPTGLLSNRTLQRSILRCSGHGRPHGWLQGQVNGKNRTTMASVYPRKFCQALIKDIKKVINFVSSIYWECERCQMGQFAPRHMEHSLIPGQCRHGRWPDDDPRSQKSKAAKKEENLLDIFKREALTNRKIAQGIIISGGEIGLTMSEQPCSSMLSTRSWRRACLPSKRKKRRKTTFIGSVIL